MAYFTISQEKTMRRLKVLQELLAERDLHAEPCPLLLAQLDELDVLLSKLASEVADMRRHLIGAEG